MKNILTSTPSKKGKETGEFFLFFHLHVDIQFTIVVIYKPHYTLYRFGFVVY